MLNDDVGLSEKACVRLFAIYLKQIVLDQRRIRGFNWASLDSMVLNVYEQTVDSTILII